MKKKNKQLIRQCISCRMQIHKEMLVRICKTNNAITGEKKVVVNASSFEFGRSAYICRKNECIQAVIKGKKLSKMLRVSPNVITPELIHELQNQIIRGKEVA